VVDQRLQRSRAQESRGAALHGGRRTPGSGNTPWRKNDVRVDRNYLIEYKRTDRKSITIKLEDLEALRTNAYLEGRNPLFGIEIGGRDWTLVESTEFERIRSGCAGTELGTGELSDARPRNVLPATRSNAQEPTPRSQGRVQGQARRASRVPGAGGVS
jgi:Holliday junction resolvase